MKKHSIILAAALIGGALLTLTGGLACQAASGRVPVIFVAAGASPEGDGASWATAFDDLQEALRRSRFGQQIWIAAGTYRPTSGDDREASFQLKRGVALFGGFSGEEASLDQRNPEIHRTVLSGDLRGNDTERFAGRMDNSYHVVVASGVDSSCVLDGLVICGGQADAFPEHQTGGGLHLRKGSPVVRGCRFENNYAFEQGGGCYVEAASPSLRNCTFEGNRTEGYGGGLQVTGGSPELSACLFADNRSVGGGGCAVDIWNSNPVLRNCRFRSGEARNDYMLFEGSCAPTIIDTYLVDLNRPGAR